MTSAVWQGQALPAATMTGSAVANDIFKQKLMICIDQKVCVGQTTESPQSLAGRPGPSLHAAWSIPPDRSRPSRRLSVALILQGLASLDAPNLAATRGLFKILFLVARHLQRPATAHSQSAQSLCTEILGF